MLCGSRAGPTQRRERSRRLMALSALRTPSLTPRRPAYHSSRGHCVPCPLQSQEAATALSCAAASTRHGRTVWGAPSPPGPSHAGPRLRPSRRGRGRAAPRPPACQARADHEAPGQSPGTRDTGMVSPVHHGDGHGRVGSPGLTSHETDSPCGAQSAVRCPPCGGGAGAAAGGRVAQQEAVGAGAPRVHPAPRVAWASDLVWLKFSAVSILLKFLRFVVYWALR